MHALFGIIPEAACQTSLNDQTPDAVQTTSTTALEISLLSVLGGLKMQVHGAKNDIHGGASVLNAELVAIYSNC